MAHVHIAVEADTSDAEKRRYTGGDADATESYTQTRFAVVEVGALHHACENIDVKLTRALLSLERTMNLLCH